MRGFDTRGIGPSSDGNALGGTLYWASGLHLYAPLPFRPGRGGFGDLFRSHVFVTAGNVGNFWLSGTMGRDLEQVTQDFRLSYGLGLALKLGGVARIELNYCVPVKVCHVLQNLIMEIKILISGLQRGQACSWPAVWGWGQLSVVFVFVPISLNKG